MSIFRSYFKYYTIFLTFSLISNIILYEKIPLWNPNEIKMSLPEDLFNSEIISISSDNTTDKILYLIKENDNSMLYINGKKHKNIFENELTYLSSPLVEIENDYYFCSSLKNILKLNSNGTLNKIPNPKALDNYNNYQLKCFYMQKEKAIIVTFINTPYVLTYDFAESNWKVNNYQDYQLMLGEKIYDSNLYNINNINELRFGVLYTESFNYIFSIYQYNNFQFGPIYNLYFQGKFYSKAICTFGNDFSQVYIFTYEPEKLNQYDFYQLDIGQSKCINNEGNLYLRLFKEAEIIEVFFIENSPTLFYHIRKKELNGQFGFYIGAVDIENLVVLYNIKIDKDKRVFYNYGFLYENKGFLKYYDGGNQVVICPFIYDPTNNICQYFINENNYFIFENNNGLNENKISESCLKILNNKYCIDECPIGYEIENNGCKLCPNDYYYNYATKKCIFEPNQNYTKKGKIIYNCEEINLKYFEEDCYNSCSDIYGIPNSANENECISCKSQNKIYYDFNCYDSCQELYGIINPDNKNECILCKNENKIYFESNCYNNCSEIYGIINPGNENECIACKNENKIYYDYGCYNNCSEIYGIINPKDENECIICKDENKFFLENKCLNSCQDGYSVINDQIHNHNVSYCQKCKEINKYYYNEACYDECPLPRHLFDSDNICYLCHEINIEEKYYQNGTCVSECEDGYETIEYNNEFYCIYCKDKGKYFTHNKTCQNNCEEHSLFYEENNICYFCHETDNKYLQNNTCVNSCERGYETNEGEYYCQYCHNIDKYFNEGKCEDNCPENLAWNDTDNICIDCHKEFGMLLLEHKCVESCILMKVENFICKRCSENKKYFFFYDCFETCPNYTIPAINDDIDYCTTCEGSYYQEGECVSGCSNLYVQNETEINGRKQKICVKCGTDNKSWLQGDSCTTKCPESTYASDDHYCRLCFCGFLPNFNCDQFSDKCQCDQPNIFGDNCEFYSKNKNDEKILKIIPLGPSISTKKSFFTYNLQEDILNKNNIISIKWKLFLNDIEVTEPKYFTTGVNDDIFIINSNSLNIGNGNKISLEINICDKNNPSNSYIYKDEIEISIQSLERQKSITLKHTTDQINKIMNNTFYLEVDRNINIEQIKFYYKILIKDMYNEIIPINKKGDLDELLSRSSDDNIHFILPFFIEFIFQLTNNREERNNIITKPIGNENKDIKYTLEEIINNSPLDDYSEIEKIFLIIKYLDLNKNEVFSDKIYDSLIKFIKEKIFLFENEKCYYEDADITEKTRYYINYYEPKTIFSLINHILLHQKENFNEKYFYPFLNIFKIFWDIITEKRNPGKYIEKLPFSDIISFFRSFDHFLEIYNNKEIIDEDNIINKKIIFDILNIMSEYLVVDTYPGETIRLVGKRISLILSHFSKNQKHMAFSSVNDISKKINYENYSSFSLDDYYLNKEKCDDDGNTLLCIKPKDFNEIKQNSLNKINIDFFSLAVFTINSFNHNLQSNNEGDTLKIKLINKDEIKQTYKINNIFYDIEFSLKDAFIQNNITQLYLKTSTENDYSNITCIPKNNLLQNDSYCLTYFNYETKIIKCSCNIFDDISYVSDSNLAKYYKDLQANKIIKKYNYINKISLILILTIIIIVLLPGCFYLLYDIKNDEKNYENNSMTFSEKIKQKYLQVKKLNNSSIFSFALHASMYQFPYFSPFRTCDYKSPKYIKHFVISIAIFYGFFIALIPFYIFVPFKELKDIIDKRDIKNPNFEVNTIVLFRYINRGIIFSIFGVCVTRLIIYIFGIIFSYNNDEFEFWREMKTIFTNYIYNEIKGNVLLGPTWNKIKTRMIAYINICGDYILNKRKNNKKTNFDDYLLTKEKSSECKSNTNRLLPSDDLDEGINLDFSDIKSNKSGNYRAPSIDSINNSFRNRNIDNHYSLNVETINNTSSKSSKSSKKEIKSKKELLEVINTDNFQLYSRKIKRDKTITKNNKFERIKNKYICTRKNKVLYEIEIDSMSENALSYNEFYYNTQLTIENKINLSYLSLPEFITNDTLNLYSDNTWETTKINMKFKPEGYWKLVIVNIILFILLLLLIFGIFVFDKIFLNYFGIFIIKVWLISAVCIYAIIYPLFYYIKNCIGSFLLFKCYHLKNRFYNKIFFTIFVNKTMVYIFKVRNYITKYNNELDY